MGRADGFLLGKSHDRSNRLTSEFVFFVVFFRPRSVYRPLNPLVPSRGGFLNPFSCFWGSFMECLYD